VLVIRLTFPDLFSSGTGVDHARLENCKPNATISVTSLQNRSEARAPITRRVETLLLVWPYNLTVLKDRRIQLKTIKNFPLSEPKE
jgi:hypothetical protein